MARRGTSAHTKYRYARARVAELEARRAKLERARPRTPGKRAARTRAINKTKRQLGAARGLLTKARNAIAEHARANVAHKRAADQKRSEAAKKGWAKRRTTSVGPAMTTGKPIPFLTTAGVRRVWPPLKTDRSKVGSYWNEVNNLLSNKPASFERFVGDSIYDELSGERFPFVTDPNVIYAYSDTYDFGEGFYRDRREARPFAA